MPVISLGLSCTTKFQILRHSYFVRHPAATMDDFRASEPFIHLGTHIFDWQVTPLPAVTAYIDRDFVGIFERENLVVDERLGIARNNRFDVIHTHAFHPLGTLTEADIDAQYPVARCKIEYLAAKFRRLLDRERGEVLFIASHIPPADEVERLIGALSRRAPRLRYRLAFVGKSDASIHDLSALGVRRFIVNADAGKPSELAWEGDDSSWETVLRELIGVPGWHDRLFSKLSPVSSRSEYLIRRLRSRLRPRARLQALAAWYARLAAFS
jgi:hypothetical protein